jgi:hypothetical protein
MAVEDDALFHQPDLAVFDFIEVCWTSMEQL